jgi:iron(III) transport system substrate-binding protein
MQRKVLMTVGEQAGSQSTAWRLLAGLSVMAAILLSLLLASTGCQRSDTREVVVYAAQDQVFAEPILREFTRETGIRVRTVFDSEAVKTVGLANRLLAETNRPQADVFWGNEEFRTRQLAALGVFRPTNGWAAFGFRSRRLVVNTRLAPHLTVTNVLYLRELTNQTWRGKIALAYPLFGTTATHFHALRQYWGTAAWEQWCRALQANQPLLVDGNSVVVNLVGRGEAALGLTDSDDLAAGKKRGYPIIALPLTEETLLIPNTVAVIRHAPHPAEAEALFRYLQTRPVLDALLNAEALEGAQPGLRPHLKVRWDEVLRDLEDTNERLKKIFLR